MNSKWVLRAYCVGGIIAVIVYTPFWWVCYMFISLFKSLAEFFARLWWDSKEIYLEGCDAVVTLCKAFKMGRKLKEDEL